MKNLKNANTIALLIPILPLFLFPFFKEGVLIFSLLLTMVTGFMQVCIGLSFWWHNPNHVQIKIYLLAVTAFFPVKYFTDCDALWAMPLLLCGYLSFIIYTHKTEAHENA